MKHRLIDYTTICIVLITMFVAGLFAGHTLALIYHKNATTLDLNVSVTPRGWSYNPYTHIRQMGVIDKQDFRVVFKNNVQVSSEFLGYTYRNK